MPEEAFTRETRRAAHDSKNLGGFEKGMIAAVVILVWINALMFFL